MNVSQSNDGCMTTKWWRYDNKMMGIWQLNDEGIKSNDGDRQSNDGGMTN